MMTKESVMAKENVIELDVNAAGNKKKKIILYSILGLLVCVLSVVIYVFVIDRTTDAVEISNDDGNTDEEKSIVIQNEKARYLNIEEPFIINIDNSKLGNHFLKVKISILYRKEDMEKDLLEKVPYLKDQVIEYFSVLSMNFLKNSKNKIKMKNDIKEILNNMMDSDKKEAVDKILFIEYIVE